MTSLLAFFAEIDWSDVAQAALDTLTMLAWSLGWTVLLGLPLGIVLYLTGEPRLLYAPRLYRLLSLCVNVLRSLPFIILLIVMIPVTTLLTGTSLGVEGTIPPLVAGCARSSPGWWKPPCARWSTAWWRPAGRWAAAPGSLSGTRCCRSRGPG
jgi:D-methionine transport system permease protein